MFKDIPVDFIVCFGSMLAVMVILIGTSPRKRKA
jgi:hypothetical protein